MELCVKSLKSRHVLGKKKDGLLRGAVYGTYEAIRYKVERHLCSTLTDEELKERKGNSDNLKRSLYETGAWITEDKIHWANHSGKRGCFWTLFGCWELDTLRERLVAAITALIRVPRNAPLSSSLIPAMVVPAGETKSKIARQTSSDSTISQGLYCKIYLENGMNIALLENGMNIALLENGMNIALLENGMNIALLENGMNIALDRRHNFGNDKKVHGTQ
ncbi:hypothetical protein MUK42_05719 [Musa troglodytarum]|uniref:Uncharacterized protein n=1 Tax=Musa troglodytarum TaxID=320322 RepID=A0A9E7EKA0_9LILI|nr:hypothetical protein MUK42_05719 [Musa troglodytarum]